jgi:DNA-binding transcriptional ArsR family regulator
MQALKFRLDQYPEDNPFTETRRKVLAVLSKADGPMTVSATSRACGVPMGTLSHEVRVLERTGIIESRREGRSKMVWLRGWPVIVT